VKLGRKGRFWFLAGVPPWLLGRALIRAGQAFVRLHFRLWERAAALPPGAIILLLAEERLPVRGPLAAAGQEPRSQPSEADWQLAVAELARQIRNPSREER
jgi:hypothetical protein